MRSTGIFADPVARNNTYMRGADALIKGGQYSKACSAFLWHNEFTRWQTQMSNRKVAPVRYQVGQIAVYRDFSAHSMLSIL